MRLLHRVFLINLLKHSPSLSSPGPIQTHLSPWRCSFFCWIAGLASLSISHSAALSFFDKSSTLELRKQVQTLQKEENQIRNIQAGNQNKVCCSTKNHSSFFFLSYFLSLFPLSLAPQQLISPLGSLVWYNTLYKCIQERRMECHVVTHD